MPSIRRFPLVLLFALVPSSPAIGAEPSTTPASQPGQISAASPVTVQEKGDLLSCSNGLITWRYHAKLRSFSVHDDRADLDVLTDATFSANGWGTPRNRWTAQNWTEHHSVQPVTDAFGQGTRIAIELVPSDDPAHDGRFAVQPTYAFSYTIYQGRGVVVMGSGLRNHRSQPIRLLSSEPLFQASLLPGRRLSNALMLNGAAGSQGAAVRSLAPTESANSLLVTALADDARRSVVWGGLQYRDFGRWTTIGAAVSATGAVINGRFWIGCQASDPVGRMVAPGETYWAEDTSYLDVATNDPFTALEAYGQALRMANHARPNVYDFPVLCGWSVGAISKLPNINNSVALVKEMDAAVSSGLTRYTPVAIRLEPDKYHGNSEQGWWDDEHFRRYGHLVEPYPTIASWCRAITERGGIPYTYFQCGLPSNDYALAFPGHMLGNDISRLAQLHSHHQPLVTYDYTDPDFQKHMQEVWSRLKADGIRGIKFDYPETVWRPEGGFDDPKATAASAYRTCFRLCRDGLGQEAFIDERNLGESGRPCLDVTAGIVDTQRNWTDSNGYAPAMVSIGGLRWYKNRTVFNYFPDTKTVHDCSPGIRQSMLTMMLLTSGRLDLATSFTFFTPEIVKDVSRVFPVYHERFTARPLDAFTGVKDPQVYDLELAPDWHQVALFNSGKTSATIAVPLTGDRVATGALGLDPSASWYVYDFWSDQLVGRLGADARIERRLDPLHCAMLSVRRVQPHPQVLSTDRHVLQGWVELSDVAWDANTRTLSGSAKLIGKEPMHIVIAGNGLRADQSSATGAQSALAPHPSEGLRVLTLTSDTSVTATWRVTFAP